ncbi:MAG TPA: hypothetical protein VMK53_01605 [Gemmatimonadales bacterium]|nr:hypothetical protein [Gemmatimonadales bacterium]
MTVELVFLSQSLELGLNGMKFRMELLDLRGEQFGGSPGVELFPRGPNKQRR